MIPTEVGWLSIACDCFHCCLLARWAVAVLFFDCPCMQWYGLRNHQCVLSPHRWEQKMKRRRGQRQLSNESGTLYPSKCLAHHPDSDVAHCSRFPICVCITPARDSGYCQSFPDSQNGLSITSRRWQVFSISIFHSLPSLLSPRSWSTSRHGKQVPHHVSENGQLGKEKQA